MAKLRKKTKGAVPLIDEASDNLISAEPIITRKTPAIVKQQEELKPLNFKVPASFKREYKQFALDNDLSLVDILKLSFAHYKKVTK